MGEHGTRSAPERQSTDESLRTERKNADEALDAHHLHAEQDADLVVARARETADAVLDAARDEADEGRGRATTAALSVTRAREDHAVQDERDAADVALEQERAVRRLALARLLPLERDKTDRYLLTERNRADTDVSHRDDFLGIVSHDLRNLLNGIELSAQSLIDSASASAEGARATTAATRIQGYSARMNRLIGDLLDVASIDAGKLSVTRQRGDVATVIDEVIDLLQPLARAKQIALEISVVRPHLASFDHDRVVQLLANLVTNAIKFTEPGGRIVIADTQTSDGLSIAVTDTGIGIPADKLDSVFERFAQVSTQDRRGIGLGLYIARCIAHAHGGEIWVESKLGEGSTFTFSIV